MNDVLVASRKGLFTVGHTPSGWKIANAEFLGDNVTLAIRDPRSGYRFAALDHGHFGVKLHRDRGNGFEEIAVPVYPPKPEGYEEHDMWGRPLAWSLSRIWALVPGGSDQPGTLWCGTLPGGLFKSTDHGDTWSMVRSLWDHPMRSKWMGGGADLPGLHSICVHPLRSSEVTIAVSTGGLWHTADGGVTWSQRGEGMRADHVPPELTNDPIAQDVHCLVQCRTSPDRMWIQHHNGIFISNDAGRTFREIERAGPSTFGFPVVVHPSEPGTAWFVPEIKDEKRIPVGGRLVVTRTRDGGETFETLTRGLPQDHAYDVVYRHGLDLDESGDRLAMGSTTGGFWISEDQGDTWEEVTHTLPPVYAVRWS